MEEINRKLNEFEDKIARKYMKQSLTEVCRPVAQTVRENIRSKIKRRKGVLLKSIGTWFFKNINEAYVGPKTGKKSKYDAWYAHFLEFGTSSNSKRIRSYSSKLVTMRNGFTMKKTVGTTTGHIKQGGGITARPFMRPAWDRHKDSITENFRLNMKAKLGL